MTQMGAEVTTPPLTVSTGKPTDFAALAQAVSKATKDTSKEQDDGNNFPPDLWRWSRHGHGDYKGRWYRYVNIANRKITRNGGVLNDTIRARLAVTHPRKGSGDHNTGASRKSRRTKDTTRK